MVLNERYVINGTPQNLTHAMLSAKEIVNFVSGMVYHFSDLFQYITSDGKEDLAEWQVKKLPSFSTFLLIFSADIMGFSDRKVFSLRWTSTIFHSFSLIPRERG